MNCKNCRSDVDRKWKFCPMCGAKIFMQEKEFFSLGDVFTRMNKEIEKMSRHFENNLGKVDRDFEVFDLTPFFAGMRKPEKRGFSIRIERKTGAKPEIDVKTFGNTGRKTLEKTLGIKAGKTADRAISAPESRDVPEKIRQVPKKTEEPKTKVTRIGEKLIVEMKLPGVKSVDDINIKKMLESVEVKGYAKDKLYFKILQIPKGARIADRSFSKEILRLEIL